MSQQETKDMAKHFYRASAADFMKIPGSPVAYWVTPSFLELFISESRTLSKHGVYPATGLQTGDNKRFIRCWFEISHSSRGTKWVNLNDGGDVRKWYGNFVSCIDWTDNGEKIASHKSSVIRNSSFYFREGATWNRISSSFFAIRYLPEGFIFDQAGDSLFVDKEDDLYIMMGFLNSKVGFQVMKILCPTLNATAGSLERFPYPEKSVKHVDKIKSIVLNLIDIYKSDWDSKEESWDFQSLPIFRGESTIRESYRDLREAWRGIVQEAHALELENNKIFIESHNQSEEISEDISEREITLLCNPAYRYGDSQGISELENKLCSDTFKELVSYSIGCMMGRYSLDKPGLILASQGETLQNYLEQVPSPSFAPDENAILPLTDQEWFPDDATNRFREFIRVVWGNEHLQENLDFVAESLCLHAIKPKRGESALDTIRRYLSTQFYKDHLRTYKKRPIYWLFSSGKYKAFECLVYLHRYNESTLARMRTEYVIPLSAKLNAYADKLEQDKDASSSTAETKRLEKELVTLHKQQTELAEFDEKLRHYADQRISLDLDDGVKVNYGKFGDLLAQVKDVTGEKPQ